MSTEGASPTEGLTAVLARARANWGWLLALGLLLVLLGGIAVAQSVFVTIASMVMIGVLMILGAVAHVVAALRAQGWKHFTLWIVGGLIYLLAGLAVIVNPVLASGILTLLVALTLLAAGVARIWMGVKARPGQGWAGWWRAEW